MINLKKSFKRYKEKKPFKEQVISNYYKERKMVEIVIDEFSDEWDETEMAILPKWDGFTNSLNYDRSLPEGKRCKFVSRYGSIIEDIPVLEEASHLLDKQAFKTAIFMGETIVIDEKNEILPFGISQGIIKAPRSKKEEGMICFRVYDYIQRDNVWLLNPKEKEGVSKYGKVPASGKYPSFRDREEEWKRIFKGGDRVKPTPVIYSKNLKDVKKEYNKWVKEKGFEGLVVRFGVAMDENSVKIKPFRTYDLAIVGCKEEKDKHGKPKDALGAALTSFIEEKEGEKIFILNSWVGTGFEKEERKNYWNDFKKSKVKGPYLGAEYKGLVWVQPEKVFEIQWMDNPISEVPSLTFSKGKYKIFAKERLTAKMRMPRFSRERKEKKIDSYDCGERQIKDFVKMRDVYEELKKIRPELTKEASFLELKQDEIIKFGTYKEPSTKEKDLYYSPHLDMMLKKLGQGVYKPFYFLPIPPSPREEIKLEPQVERSLVKIS